MREFFIAAAVFGALVAATLGSLVLCRRLPEHHRKDDTHAVIKVAATVFILMASVLLGLLVNSVRNTFDTADKTLHAFATEIILLDRALRVYGPETAPARKRLGDYTQEAIEGTWPTEGTPIIADAKAGAILDGVAAELRGLVAADATRADILTKVEQRMQRVIELRWTLIGASRSTVYTPLFVMLIAWLVLIFASVGFNAPFNPVVVTTTVLAAFVISTSLYIVLDLDLPFDGPVRISPQPLQQALAIIRS
jgi:hypothetical protein